MSQATPWQIATKNTSTGGSTQRKEFAQRVNADTASNLNNLVIDDIPIDGAIKTVGTIWAINGDGIQYNGPGEDIDISCNIYTQANFNRGNLTIQFRKNGTIFGPIAASGYIRNNNGHNASSYAISQFNEFLANGDIITVSALREANAGNINLGLAGASFLRLERIASV